MKRIVDTNECRKGIKSKAEPSNAMEEVFFQWMGCVRLVYNTALEQRKMRWSSHKKGVYYEDQSAEIKIKELSRDPELKFLAAVPAECYQQGLKQLQKAFENFLIL